LLREKLAVVSIPYWLGSKLRCGATEVVWRRELAREGCLGLVDKVGACKEKRLLLRQGIAVSFSWLRTYTVAWRWGLRGIEKWVRQATGPRSE